jgi:hypothetical protein
MPPLDTRKEAVVILVGLLVLLTLTEMWFSYRDNRHYYEKRDTLTNIYLTALAFILNLAVNGSMFFLLSYAYQFRLFQINNTGAVLVCAGCGAGSFVLGAALYRALLQAVLGHACYTPLVRAF